MTQTSSLSGKLALDAREMDSLRQAARENSPEAVRESARQFEALFMNMVMKSMRAATPQDGVFDSEQSRMYTSMLDQQLSQNMAQRGVGLADILIRQLSPAGIAPGQTADSQEMLPPAVTHGAAGNGDDRMRQAFNAMASGIRAEAALAPANTAVAANVPLPVLTDKPNTSRVQSAFEQAGRSGGARAGHVRAFEDKLAAHAEAASRTTGIPAKFMLGQAALETGWGRHEIKAADGTTSHNLFGIKATGGWKGKVVSTVTTEYVNGVAQRKVEKFRAYDSYADAFRDYGQLLSKNPRYRHVMENARDVHGFAQGLQKAGYATDPNYAAKLTSIITKILSA